VSSFFTASEVATAAFVRIWRFGDPAKFGADFVDAGIGARHFLLSLLRQASTYASDKVSSCGTQALIHRGASISNRHESHDSNNERKKRHGDEAQRSVLELSC
jgi:hypothetical protein